MALPVLVAELPLSVLLITVIVASPENVLSLMPPPNWAELLLIALATTVMDPLKLPRPPPAAAVLPVTVQLSTVRVEYSFKMPPPPRWLESRPLAMVSPEMVTLRPTALTEPTWNTRLA
jgi:hypothetical protein